jgi:hypothetical protein
MNKSLLIVAMVLSFDQATLGQAPWAHSGAEEKRRYRQRKSTPVVCQIVVHNIKRISFSLAEVLRFGIAC